MERFGAAAEVAAPVGLCLTRVELDVELYNALRQPYRIEGISPLRPVVVRGPSRPTVAAPGLRLGPLTPTGCRLRSMQASVAGLAKHYGPAEGRGAGPNPEIRVSG